jgi:hypothetical protein
MFRQLEFHRRSLSVGLELSLLELCLLPSRLSELRSVQEVAEGLEEAQHLLIELMAAPCAPHLTLVVFWRHEIGLCILHIAFLVLIDPCGDGLVEVWVLGLISDPGAVSLFLI